MTPYGLQDVQVEPRTPRPNTNTNADASDPSAIVLNFHSTQDTLERFVPILIVFGIVFVWIHHVGLLTFIGPTFVFYHVKQGIDSAVRSSAIDVGFLLLCVPSAIGHVIFLRSMAASYGAAGHLMLANWHSAYNLKDALWLTCLNDSVVAFCIGLANAIALLIFHTAGLKSRKNRRRRRNILAFLNNVGLFYRTLLPIPIWFTWMLSLEDIPTGARVVLAWLYLVFKFTVAFIPLQDSLGALANIIFNTGIKQHCSSGTPLNEGERCPICFDDMESPIGLPCQHQFCGECIEKWFESRSTPTCPLCRKDIKGAGDIYPLTDPGLAYLAGMLCL